jgi:hypothetical protein
VPPKVGGAADVLASALQAPTTFFIFFNCIQQKNTQDQSTITNRPWENYYKALECKAKKLEWHG